jgi:hypothetical protein
VRDLCRAHADLLDLQRPRRQLDSFLLRHGRIYRGGTAWTGLHESWLAAQINTRACGLVRREGIQPRPAGWESFDQPRAGDRNSTTPLTIR